jgi:putative FmdB family regulatory protein
MPLYEYQCGACDKRFEVIQKFSDPPVEICKVCGKGPVQRLQSSPAIHFKGSGWYITDYAKKAPAETASSGSDGKGGEAKAVTKSEGATKTETAAKSDSSTGSATPTGSAPKE